MKCDWPISFIQVELVLFFQKLHQTNICTSSFSEFTSLHSETSQIMHVESYKSFNARHLQTFLEETVSLYYPQIPNKEGWSVTLLKTESNTIFFL